MKQTPLIPLLSISGLTLVSFGGLVLLKSLGQPSSAPKTPPLDAANLPTEGPTQVPKSIQHYLLASQQYFSQAVQMQGSSDQNNQIINTVNQAILAATDAIQNFPQDYRGYHQRAQIYLSLVQSQPQFAASALSDLQNALLLNQNSSEITKQIASLYAQAGDAPKTLEYLQKTIILEPTKAQNFYDLARLQQQLGQIQPAITTYNQLLTILTDQNQIQQVKSEKQSLETLTSQNPEAVRAGSPRPSLAFAPTSTELIPSSGSPLLQADSLASGLIIAAPEIDKSIQVENLADSNALSGTAILPANQPQLTISNSNLTSTSQVYLTIVKGGKNQSLQVTSKSTGSFTIGLPSPVPEDIEFKWWIIN